MSGRQRRIGANHRVRHAGGRAASPPPGGSKLIVVRAGCGWVGQRQLHLRPIGRYPRDRTATMAVSRHDVRDDRQSGYPAMRGPGRCSQDLARAEFRLIRAALAGAVQAGVRRTAVLDIDVHLKRYGARGLRPGRRRRHGVARLLPAVARRTEDRTGLTLRQPFIGRRHSSVEFASKPLAKRS
jgi:hypothetical protein